MSRFHQILRGLSILALSLLAIPCVGDSPHPAKATKAATPGRPAKTSKPTKGAPVADRTCKEPVGRDADLQAGLLAYGESRWKDAVTSLMAWSIKPDADKEPAAGRGLYALGYAARQVGNEAIATSATSRAEPLLQARLAQSPTLEGAYYLQAIYQQRNDQAGQLGVISSALKLVDAGTLCKAGDADDLFRLARLRGYAGDHDKQLTLLEQASAAFDASGAKSAYRPYTEKELGDAKLKTGDLPAAEKHLRAAATLDPTLPGVHRALGVALLREGKLQEALDWWREHWRVERDDGNSLVYAIPVIMTLLRQQAAMGDKVATVGVKDVASYTVEALELNSELEGKKYMELAAKQADAQKAGGTLSAEDATAKDVAELRMAQFMVEYVSRGQNLQELALQKGLLPAIHHRELPAH